MVYILIWIININKYIKFMFLTLFMFKFYFTYKTYGEDTMEIILKFIISFLIKINILLVFFVFKSIVFQAWKQLFTLLTYRHYNPNRFPCIGQVYGTTIGNRKMYFFLTKNNVFPMVSVTHTFSMTSFIYYSLFHWTENTNKPPEKTVFLRVTEINWMLVISKGE